MPFAILSILSIGLAGLGWFTVRMIGLRSACSAQVFLLGVSFFYLAVLLRFPLSGVFLLLVAGLLYFVVMLWHLGLLTNLNRVVSYSPDVLLVAVFSLLLFLVISGEPLTAWDARSIWFFKAKILFYDNGFVPSSFMLDELKFMHPDYPILLPSLAGVFATGLGYWNEYAPKLILLLPILAAALGLKNSSESIRSFLLCFVFVILFLGENIWNGYADASLALLGLAATSHLVRACGLQGEEKQSSMLSSLMFALLCLYIKTEGLFILVSVCAVMGLLHFWSLVSLLKSRAAIALSFLMLPQLLWVFWKVHYKFPNYFSDSMNIRTVLDRLRNWDSLVLILTESIGHKRFVTAALFFIGLLTFRYFRRQNSWVSRAQVYLSGMLVVFIYLASVMFTYLLTPLDLSWHINTSVNRLMLFPSCVAFWGSLKYLFVYIWGGHRN